MNFEQAKLVYTLSTSTRAWDEFIKLLSNYDVAVVVDVLFIKSIYTT